MDDFVVWRNRGAELRHVWREVAVFLRTELRLDLKENVAVNKTAFGMDFLGYRIFPGELRQMLVCPCAGESQTWATGSYEFGRKLFAASAISNG